jgi:hypothetical protein
MHAGPLVIDGSELRGMGDTPESTTAGATVSPR